jgi:hypothetical protein
VYQQLEVVLLAYKTMERIVSTPIPVGQCRLTL